MGGERPWRPLASSGIQGKHIPQEGPRCSQLPLGNGGFGGLEGSDSVGVCLCCGHLALLPLCRWGLCSSSRPRWSSPGFLNLSATDIFGLANPFVEANPVRRRALSSILGLSPLDASLPPV